MAVRKIIFLSVGGQWSLCQPPAKSSPIERILISSSGDNEYRFPSRLESRCLTASISSSFSFHRRSNSLAASRFRASTASYCSKAFFASYTSCSSLRDGRHVELRRRRSVLPALANWLPPPKARSPLVAYEQSVWNL